MVDGFLMRTTRPPVDYLVTTSRTSLESFQCARLNLAATLRKEVRQILDEWISVEVDARLAAWVLDRRRAQEAGRDQTESLPAAPVHLAQLAISFLSPSPDEPHGEETGEQNESGATSGGETSSRSATRQVDLSFGPEKSAARSSKPSPYTRRRNPQTSFGQCALRVVERLENQAPLEIGDGTVHAPRSVELTGRSVQDANARPQIRGKARSRSKAEGQVRPASPLRVHYARTLSEQRRLAAAS